MLTPSDIHYLVGLLTRISEASDVQIELGDMVFDSAAEKERDVDITVTQKNNDGSLTVYRGVEVKDHGRPLDVGHVEQLCIKFNDMPSITHKAIVSASGYTNAAVKKAFKHGVELLEILNWENPSEGFEHVKFPKEMPFIQRGFTWVSDHDVKLLLQNDEEYNAFLRECKNNPPVCDQFRGKYPDADNLETLVKNIGTSALTQLSKSEDSNKFQPNETKDVTIHWDFLNHPHVLIDGKRIPIPAADISGKVKLVAVDSPVHFKVLRKFGELKPIAGCAITELIMGNIMGMSVSNTRRDITLLNIPIGDRMIKKPYKKKLN